MSKLGSSPHILLVEDDQATSDVLLEVFEIQNYRVQRVGDAEKALELLDSGFCPQLIVTDWLLPGISGRPWLNALLSRTKKNRTPTIIMSASRSLDLPDGIEWIPKPLELDDLLEKLAKHLV